MVATIIRFHIWGKKHCREREGLLPIQLGTPSEQAIEFAHAFMEDFIDDNSVILEIHNEE